MAGYTVGALHMIDQVVNRAVKRERKCAENYNIAYETIKFLTAISILAISNHNSFRVLFDKIASVYFILKYTKF